MSYFALTKFIFFLCIIASAVMAPTMMNYQSWEYHNIAEEFLHFSFFTTIGNLGSPKTQCTRVKLASKFIQLNCNFGDIVSINHWGIYQLGSWEET